MALDARNLDPNVWTEQVARDYDRSSASMYEPEVLGPAVDFLAELSGTGRALEFAIGTGRVALPLTQRGVEVHGIEYSEAMAAQLGRKPGGERIAVTIGDMATARVAGTFYLVYLVYNTITNLLTQEQQLACFRNAAAHLEAGGAFVIETFVPELRRLIPGERFLPFTVTSERLGFDEYDTVSQLLVSHHYDFSGAQPTLFESPHRYVWPGELDLMAELAGLSRTERWADWSRNEFTAESASHVSVWRKSSG